ncbi:YrdB family protein [Cellulomonas sp. ICMP 17802]|uniref:YrdB family protein n=1 Tax=Cellulomonas sp. ICMP 17802 TaxID=3239199 RepID=UPI00351BE46D
MTTPPADRPADPPAVGVLGVLAFLCELAMVALLAVAGWRLGPSTPASLALAVGLPAVAVAIWARWMAPASRHRLRRGPRVAAQTALFVAVGAVCVAAGLAAWGVTFAVIASAVFLGARDADPAPRS